MAILGDLAVGDVVSDDGGVVGGRGYDVAMIVVVLLEVV